MKKRLIISSILLLSFLFFPHQVKADLYCGGTAICNDGAPLNDPKFTSCEYVYPMGCVPQFSGTLPVTCQAKNSPYRCTYTNVTVDCPDPPIGSEICPAPQSFNYHTNEQDCCPGTIYTCTSAAAPACNGTCPSGQSCKPNSGNSACVCQSNGPRQPDVYAIFQVLEDTNNDNVGDKLVYTTGGPVCIAGCPLAKNATITTHHSFAKI